MGILTMTWGDGMAALIGQAYGHHSYEVWGIQKSWEGSTAMLFASFLAGAVVLIIAQGLTATSVAIALLAAGFATVLEAFSKLGIDNLTVPLGSAFLAYGLSLWWL